MSQQADQVVKQEEGDNDILQPKASDPFFQHQIHFQLGNLLNPSASIGRAPQQVDEFLKEEVSPMLIKYPGLLSHAIELEV